MRLAWRLVALAGLLAAGCRTPGTAAQIRAAATQPSTGSAGHPLPLASHWTTGSHRLSQPWGPATQLAWIGAGHRLLPWLGHPAISQQPTATDEAAFTWYGYEPALRELARQHLPFTLVCTQWESLLSKGDYLALPPEQNPNVVTADGAILPKVSPFGPVSAWREAGRAWTDNPFMRRLQAFYPDPPQVLFLSNNEHGKLQWHEAETDRRYLAQYGAGRDDTFKRQVVGDAWIERYRALQAGMREGLQSPRWRAQAVFVGYEASGPVCLGRWGGWRRYSLPSPGRIDPAPLMWDGGSASYYTPPYTGSTDFRVQSPQLEFMNLVFMQEEALRLNPAYRLELSTWDGQAMRAGQAPLPPEQDKGRFYASLGQTYTPERYAACVQFGMWLLRPRVVREFRGWIEDFTLGQPYFQALVAAVDRVHDDPVLRDFWRHGELVPNPARRHPYQADLPAEYQDVPRWFLLDADANHLAASPRLNDEIAVYALALVQGRAPRRRWLVYAHAPLGPRSGVALTIPGWQAIKVDVAVGGSFYLAEERHARLVPRVHDPLTTQE